ncbi:hypothetical protein [Lactiplantibacillus plajomi]|uniref:Antitoxin n=1 Tax=Lactiplantibacillus plajomi TaxID=1457217 RepID=A0ABV6JZM5_9LACO|nr:hypothetical protein [Lactiplantibacillus plajomi]
MATIVVNLAEVCKNLKRLTDNVVDYGDDLAITKPHQQNVVVISER